MIERYPVVVIGAGNDRGYLVDHSLHQIGVFLPRIAIEPLKNRVSKLDVRLGECLQDLLSELRALELELSREGFEQRSTLGGELSRLSFKSKTHYATASPQRT